MLYLHEGRLYANTEGRGTRGEGRVESTSNEGVRQDRKDNTFQGGILLTGNQYTYISIKSLAVSVEDTSFIKMPVLWFV